MGGIADYSGSLVLQLPIREACHVAVQRTNPSRQKLWKHAQAWQTAEGQRPTPVLQIVCEFSLVFSHQYKILLHLIKSCCIFIIICL
ncbi:hypothetical protein Sjap_000291 [Stephania japonica]|uniref:Uncharacterized protein n=1 Tax=Stephania japonica TaxID=461633 RepID=A0AAP0KHS4_9MAGN